MSTSSEKYELAQDEVDAVLIQLKTNIKKVEAADGEAKKRLVQVDNIRDGKYFNKIFSQVCSGLFEDAGKSLDEMDREAKSAPLQFRAEMLANVRKYRKELNSLQSQFTKSRMQRSSSSSYGAAGSSSSFSNNVPVQDQYRQQVTE